VILVSRKKGLTGQDTPSICAVIHGGVLCQTCNRKEVLENNNLIREDSQKEITTSDSLCSDNEVHLRFKRNYLAVGQIFDFGSGVTAIVSNRLRSCVIKEGGVWCWGKVLFAESVVTGTDALLKTARWKHHNPSVLFDSTPVQVPGLESGVTDIVLGRHVGYAVKDGAVWCWGSLTRRGNLQRATYTEEKNCLGNDVESYSDGAILVPGLQNDVTKIYGMSNDLFSQDGLLSIQSGRIKVTNLRNVENYLYKGKVLTEIEVKCFV
jgi:hypothetical protein